MSLVFRLRGKSCKLWCEGKEVHFFPTRRRTSTNAYDEDENMNNDSLIERMRVVVFARSTPGKALNTLSCEAIIVVRFGGHFSPRTST